MATIKSFTSVEQSRKLAEILPLESADMCYTLLYTGASLTGQSKYNDFPCVLPSFAHGSSAIPCWSAGALLEIIKKLVGYSLQSLDTHTVFMNCELGGKPYNIETENYDNPIDACYEMILKLHELNLL